MLWESILVGLKVLTYWETYVAGLEYLAISLIPIIIVGLVMDRSETTGSIVGCLSMILLPVLQVAAIAVFALTLAPIIFGFSDDAAWSFPWKVITLAPGAFFRLMGVLVVTAIALGFIPFLGQLQSLQTLVLGGIALGFVLRLFQLINPGLINAPIDFIPDFWFSVGLVVVGGLMTWVGTMAAALLGTALEMAEEGLGQMIMLPIAAIFGFFPVFVYGAWLGAQVPG